MKKLTITLLCLLPITSFAQNPMGMSEADMQKMMVQMQEAQACMEKVDQSQLKALENKSKQFQADMKSLCASGKRGEAQDKAIAFSKEVMNDPAVKQVRKCSEKMKGMMQGMTQNMPYMGEDKDYSNTHVCDSGI